jgi:hypothetical protein
MPDYLLQGERDLWQYWADRCLPGGALTRDGRGVRVLFPGVLNTGPGPDFLGALIALNGAPAQRGDVELHLRASSWVAHRHHQDPRYGDVCLHVVLFDDGGTARTLLDRVVPVLGVGNLLPLDPAVGPVRGGPCLRPEAQRLAPEALRAVLRAAGEARFAGRAARWEGECLAQPIEAVVLRALLSAAGLGRNREACAALAEALDGPVLETLLASAGATAERTAAAVLLGMAGLLDAGRASDEERRLWEHYRSFWPGVPLPARCWRRFRLRPANLPEARLRTLARVLARRGLRGYLDQAAALICREHPPLAALYDLLQGRRAWAIEVWASVVLPLLAGWGNASGDPVLARRAAWLYARLPGGGESGVLARMTELSGLVRPPKAAIEQQGLLHVWVQYCSNLDCSHCPLLADASSARGRTPPVVPVPPRWPSPPES